MVEEIKIIKVWEGEGALITVHLKVDTFHFTVVIVYFAVVIAHFKVVTIHFKVECKSHTRTNTLEPPFSEGFGRCLR